jgi:hypothetical protein
VFVIAPAQQELCEDTFVGVAELQPCSALMIQIPGLAFGPDSGDHQTDCNPNAQRLQPKKVTVAASTAAPIAVPAKRCTETGSAAPSVDCMTISVEIEAQ